ncbi:MAG: hypothetical protein JWR39_918 [Devosia sp.]|jgi:uncharacterized protein YcbK (DUF882 family)|nr:hypothetical protein [Devosia sp.]
MIGQAVVPASAATERSLYLYYTHTKETARIVFKRNGQYVQSGLNDLNRFLRDWRRNEPAKMDPRLFDLVWEVYQEVGATQPINIVSAYRSPATNKMLRETSSGVAENSQHTKGHAMDFFIPGVSLSRLRAAAMRKQVGGVGFYPTSGSPFVHLDTGSVRAWPRMTRAQLKEVFPDGRTMHLPTDGKPLSQEGYRLAQAEWQRCRTVPCGNGGSGTQVAGAGNSLIDMIFGGNKGKEQQAPAPTQMASAGPASQPAQLASVTPVSQPSQAATVSPPIPMMRPASLGAPAAASAVAVAEQAPPLPFSTQGSAPLAPAEVLTASSAPIPATKSPALLMATASTLPSGNGETAVVALAALSQPYPQPRTHMTDQAEPEMVTAYLPPLGQNGTAQQALRQLIEQEVAAEVTPIPAAPVPNLPPLGAAGVHTASLGGEAQRDPTAGLFASTFDSVQTGQSEPVAKALAAMIARDATPAPAAAAELIAPDLEHAAAMLVTPAALSSDHFALIEAQEHKVDTATALAPAAALSPGGTPLALTHTRFTAAD